VAKTLLKQAFMADVIDGVRLPALKDRLRMLVEKRFSGVDANCTACGADCMSTLEHI
jgi:Fe-S cluster assembly protein SufD